MNKSRIKIAKPDIVKYFDGLNTRVFKISDLASILTREREFWRLAKSTTTNAFAAFLLEQKLLEKYYFPFPHRSETRYVWGEVPFLGIIQTIKERSYFTHYTAMTIHGLTEQLPKTIYLNHEQPARPQNSNLEQGRIAAAFKNRPRVSNNEIEFGDTRVCLVNGMSTDQLGVIDMTANYGADLPVNIRVTNIERTLIDIAVRPIYSGGVFEVQKAYEQAKSKVSVNRLVAMLQKLRYVYPYHQAIGFYLERAGVPETSLDLLRQLPMEYDFYLAHQMGETDYIQSWRLFVPKGF